MIAAAFYLSFGPSHCSYTSRGGSAFDHSETSKVGEGRGEKGEMKTGKKQSKRREKSERNFFDGRVGKVGKSGGEGG